MGLTSNQIIEYTGREPVLLNIAGKKVKSVYPGRALFVITEDNHLYVSGDNRYGALGIGVKNSETGSFVEVPGVTDIADIKNIISSNERYSFIVYENKILASGLNWFNIFQKSSLTEYLT